MRFDLSNWLSCQFHLICTLPIKRDVLSFWEKGRGGVGERKICQRSINGCHGWNYWAFSDLILCLGLITQFLSLKHFIGLCSLDPKIFLKLAYFPQSRIMQWLKFKKKVNIYCFVTCFPLPPKLKITVFKGCGKIRPNDW